MENKPKTVSDFDPSSPYISLEADDATNKKADTEEKTTSVNKTKGEFLPAIKNDKRIKKMKNGLLKSPIPGRKHEKVRKGLKIASYVALAALFGICAYNTIKANFYNEIPPTRDPYTSENVFDANENDYDIGEDGQIILDTVNETEKNILSKSFSELIFNDAKSRCDTEIGNIKSVLSISLLPYNLNDKNNEFDKYYLSILFNDENNKTFCLNYLTGMDFLSDAELTKDYFVEFINYLSFECALDSCELMSNDAQKIKDFFKDATFVGEAYKGARENGDRYYFIPVYNSNGEGKTYYAWAAPIDSYEQNPMQLLFDELSNPPQEAAFDFMNFTKSENLQKVFDILKMLQISPDEKNVEQKTTNPKAPQSAVSTNKGKSYTLSQEDDLIY